MSAPYQTAAITPIVIVETCGVRKRGCTLPKTAGNAPWRAIESDVREAGMIVVWVEDRPEVMIASSTSQLRPLPSTSSATALNSAVSSS